MSERGRSVICRILALAGACATLTGATGCTEQGNFDFGSGGYDQTRNNWPDIDEIQGILSRYERARYVLGTCSRDFALGSLTVGSVLDRLQQVLDLWSGWNERPSDPSLDRGDLRAGVVQDMSAAFNLAVRCGAITPEMLSEPVGDTTWWDFSSGSGGYTPPTYSPPPR
jgi:hypothetical protein